MFMVNYVITLCNRWNFSNGSLTFIFLKVIFWLGKSFLIYTKVKENEKNTEKKGKVTKWVSFYWGRCFLSLVTQICWKCWTSSHQCQQIFRKLYHSLGFCLFSPFPFLPLLHLPGSLGIYWAVSLRYLTTGSTHDQMWTNPFMCLMQAAISLCIDCTHQTGNIPVSSVQINRGQASHVTCILNTDQQRSGLTCDLYPQCRSTEIKPHVWPVSSAQINRGQAPHVQCLCLTITWHQKSLVL